MKASLGIDIKSVNCSESNRNWTLYTESTKIPKKICSDKGNTRGLVH